MGDLQIGAVFDNRFVLQQPVGTGGFGTVWRANRVSNDEVVALKILHAELHTFDGLARFRTEAEILSRLNHINVVRGYGLHVDAEQPYMVSEFLEGTELTYQIAWCSTFDSPMPLDTVQSIFTQICNGVGAAHELGVLHRDLKPPNILISKSGVVKVLDFGIAKMLEGEAGAGTTLGRRLGSYCYMSPEQILGHSVGPPTDIFALGCILFELVTHRRPWLVDEQGDPALAFCKAPPKVSANAWPEVLLRISRAEHPQASAWRAGVPDGVDQVLQRALSKKAEDRFATTHEMQDALRISLGDIDQLTVPLVDKRAMRGGSARLPVLPAWPVDPLTPTDEATQVSVVWDDTDAELTPFAPAASLANATEFGVDSANAAEFGVDSASAAEFGVDSADGTSTRVLARPHPRLRWLWLAVVPALFGIIYLSARWPSPESGPSQVVKKPVSAPTPVVRVSASPVAAPPVLRADAVRLAKSTRRPRGSADKKARRLPGKNPTTEASAPKPPAPSPWRKAEATLIALEADPANAELALRLRNEIERLSARIADPKLRRRVVRMAKSSARVGDVSGLRSSFETLKRNVR